MSFPYDFMHLIWENLIKNLVLHWTGGFKDLDDGVEEYQLPQAIWEAIGGVHSSLRLNYSICLWHSCT